MNSYKDFYKFATSKHLVSGSVLNDMAQHENKILSGYNPSINPTIIEERQLNVAAMDVFSRLMMDRIIFLGTEIDDYVANTINAQLLYLNSIDSESDISIYVNSPGGVVSDGLSIYDTMQYISANVSTICTGLAASMGSIILCAGTAGKRYALPHSRIMIHQPLGGISGQASDIDIEAKEINKIKTELYEILSLHTKQDMKKIVKDADRNYWMSAKDAVAYGMIDDVFQKNKTISA